MPFDDIPEFLRRGMSALPISGNSPIGPSQYALQQAMTANERARIQQDINNWVRYQAPAMRVYPITLSSTSQQRGELTFTVIDESSAWHGAHINQQGAHISRDGEHHFYHLQPPQESKQMPKNFAFYKYLKPDASRYHRENFLANFVRSVPASRASVKEYFAPPRTQINREDYNRELSRKLMSFTTRFRDAVGCLYASDFNGDINEAITKMKERHLWFLTTCLRYAGHKNHPQILVDVDGWPYWQGYERLMGDGSTVSPANNNVALCNRTSKYYRRHDMVPLVIASGSASILVHKSYFEAHKGGPEDTGSELRIHGCVSCGNWYEGVTGLTAVYMASDEYDAPDRDDLEERYDDENPDDYHEATDGDGDWGEYVERRAVWVNEQIRRMTGAPQMRNVSNCPRCLVALNSRPLSSYSTRANVSLAAHSFQCTAAEKAAGKKGPFYGVELEVHSRRDNREEAARKVREILNTPVPFVVCKSDGSLSSDYGLEIVSVPATFARHYEVWQEKLPAIAKIVESYPRRECGLHIHVGIAEAFTDRSLSNFMLFFNHVSNAPFLGAIGGREVGGSNRYYTQRSEVNKKSGLKRYRERGDMTEHYNITSISRTNSCKTVEVRMFKGNVAVDGFLRCLEFTDAAVYFAKATTPERIGAADFLAWFEQGENRAKYPRLFRFLVKHNYIITAHKLRDLDKMTEAA